VNGILILCTANRCRSPVAEGFLAKCFKQYGIDIPLASAGLIEGNVESPREVVRAAANFGLDLTGHRSREFQPEMLMKTDLVVTMTRRHVRAIAVSDAKAWPRTFTMRELIRRGGDVGPRRSEQSLSKWLTLVNMGRQPINLLGADPNDDVSDPMGGVPDDYDEMVEALYGLTHELVGLLFPQAIYRNLG
jgi:protein-tyrosine phosphatase